MNKCDKCGQGVAKYQVKGLTLLAFFEGLCAKCCRDYLISIGDIEGAKKFQDKAISV